MDTLKPCPFCGGTAKIHTDGTTYVFCDCGVTLHTGHRSIEKAIEAWNKRTSEWVSVTKDLPAFNEDNILIAVDINDGGDLIIESGFLNKNDNEWYYGHCCGHCDNTTKVSIDGAVKYWTKVLPPKGDE